MDETYIKVKGEWVYLYRAVDKQGKTVDFLLRKNRNKQAAYDFFEKAIALKVKKIQQGSFLTLSDKMLNNSLKAYIKNELSVHDGTILSLLMHLKYVSPVLTFDIKDFDCLPMVDQIKINRALRSLEIN